MAKRIKTRIRILENQHDKSGPIIAWQSLENPGYYTVIDPADRPTGRYYELDKPRVLMTLEAIEKHYPGRKLIKVIYVKNWKKT
jgi:hypothetical protein